MPKQIQGCGHGNKMLVVVGCITLFRLVLVDFESANFSTAKRFKYLFFTAMKIYIMAGIGQE